MAAVIVSRSWPKSIFIFTNCVTYFQCPSGKKCSLGYPVTGWDQSIWHPVSSWHRSSGTSSIISPNACWFPCISFWTPQSEISWAGRKLDSWWFCDSGLPHLTWLLLLNAICSVRQNLSGTHPKRQARALPAVPAGGIWQPLWIMGVLCLRFLVPKKGTDVLSHFSSYREWQLPAVCLLVPFIKH